MWSGNVHEHDLVKMFLGDFVFCERMFTTFVLSLFLLIFVIGNEKHPLHPAYLLRFQPSFNVNSCSSLDTFNKQQLTYW